MFAVLVTLGSTLAEEPQVVVASGLMTTQTAESCADVRILLNIIAPRTAARSARVQGDSVRSTCDCRDFFFYELASHTQPLNVVIV